jgi:hypothetical protein
MRLEEPPVQWAFRSKRSEASTRRLPEIIINGRKRTRRDVLRIGGFKGGQMKPSAKIISYVIALGVTTAMVPQASAQAPPTSPPAPQHQAPAPQQTQPQPQTNTHEKAKGAAAGAAIGAATGGSAAKGAVVGAGHSRRQERRSNR